MIYRIGYIESSSAMNIVASVNNSGYITRGISLPIARAYPEFLAAYKHICALEEIKAGTVLPIRTKGKTVVAFFVKEDWRGSSRLEWVDKGLCRLSKIARAEKWSSLAIPALGTGTGNLPWIQVKELIEKHFRDSQIKLLEIFHPRN